MTSTYACYALAFGLLAAGRAGSESLEEKVLQARLMQDQALRRDGRSADSLQALGESASRAPGRYRGTAPDSLLEGPFQAYRDSLDTAWSDSLGQDSLQRKRRRAARQPARYEQRIFQGVNRTAFGSARGAAGRDYVLGAGDVITVSLWGDKEKQYELTLNESGQVFLEGVGLVPLSGLSLQAAETRLKERLAKIYSGIARGSSHVNVDITNPGPIKVFVLGEVKTPGGYVFSGNTSVLSALYFAAGPTDIGTVRQLQLTRGGKKYALDLYRYLIHGENVSPGALQDGDILFAGRAQILAEVTGDVGRPAIYELKPGEGVKELLTFAGSPNSTAASHRMVLQRIAEGGRVEYLDLQPPREYLEGRAKMDLRDGDRLLLHKSTEMRSQFLNITGPVKYPGTYAFDSGITIKGLVEKAGGLRDDAFLGRVHVVRFRPNGSSNIYSYSLDSLGIAEIALEPRDNVFLYSQKEMFIPDSIEISGAVFSPGRYEFREGMTVKDLVMEAGGFLPSHEAGKIRVFRGDPRDQKVEQIDLLVEPGLGKAKDTYLLHPRDFVQIPTDPLWYHKEIVTLAGQVVRPGKYALLHPGEKLASVIARTGGFKENAYIDGGRFFRSRDSVGRIGVDLRKAVGSPGSKANIALAGGDSIYIPERLSTVKVIGEVGFETSLLYREGASVQYYIGKAGGFTRRSEKERIVIQYANGETSQDGYFNRKPDAGSVIYVPRGPEPERINWVNSINILIGTLTAAVTLVILTNQVSN